MRIYFRDFWYVDMADADVVFVYLMQHIYPKLIDKITENKKKCTLITYVWPIKGKAESAVSEMKDKPKIWKYIIE